MKFRKFSNTGWRVSEIGLGCWGLGGNWDDVKDDQAKKVLHRSLDKGIKFFDTSDVYGDGRSEKFLGNLKKVNLGEKYISTKVGQRTKTVSSRRI